MEANNEKKMDEFIRKSIREVGLDSPSTDFTNTLLSKIEAVSLQKTTTLYKPLITRMGWGILIVIVMALSVFAMDHKLDFQLAWLEKMNMTSLPKPEFLESL